MSEQGSSELQTRDNDCILLESSGDDEPNSLVSRRTEGLESVSLQVIDLDTDDDAQALQKEQNTKVSDQAVPEQESTSAAEGGTSSQGDEMSETSEVSSETLARYMDSESPIIITSDEDSDEDGLLTIEGVSSDDDQINSIKKDMMHFTISPRNSSDIASESLSENPSQSLSENPCEPPSENPSEPSSEDSSELEIPGEKVPADEEARPEGDQPKKRKCKTKHLCVPPAVVKRRKRSRSLEEVPQPQPKRKRTKPAKSPSKRKRAESADPPSKRKRVDPPSKRKPSERLSKRKPSERPSKRKPSERPSKRKPTERPSKRKPSERLSKRKPSERPSKRKPSERPSKRKPSERPSKRKPSERLSKRKPSEHPSKRKPSERLSKRKPSERPSKRKPSEHPSKRKSSEHPSRRKSSEHPSKRKSSEHPSKRKSSEHPSKRKSSEHPSKRKSSEHPSKRKRAESADRPSKRKRAESADRPSKRKRAESADRPSKRKWAGPPKRKPQAKKSSQPSHQHEHENENLNCSFPGCFLRDIETLKEYCGRNFNRNKDQLVRRLYVLFNETIFDKKLPKKLEICWNKKMLRTAGLCSFSTSSRPAKRHTKIDISLKVCDSADRIRDTLVHELCHAAAWLLNGIRTSHGRTWKSYARKCNMAHPELPLVTRYHNYKINYKIYYECTRCKARIGRYSRSLDTKRSVCPSCKGRLVLLPLTRKDGTPIKPHVRPFAKYVKQHYGIVRKGMRKATHKAVMRKLSKGYFICKKNNTL